ncbi:TetR/AcrR family transcriptional regulator [Clostridium kluyveri]|uniref:TetR/AcrR family transcriptional regulator n=1 Tax=Clostridium kluyveri TaxID=1534 RepID=UPI0009FA3662|nr:TetR/AcrR family transcriptional regulator [Clostridium kluyveri]UZQ52058.1 TetR/AcrR family transcriptional regulator [Clostridium kluyveri]
MNNKKDETYNSFGQFIDEEPATNTRRRGEILENVILQAAWDELNEVGYAHLTMEGVAARAKTNKPAVYRRWQKKHKLVMAALLKFAPKPDNDIPNTGNLRNDLVILLDKVMQLLQEIGSETIHGLMADYLGKELFSSPQKKSSISKEKWNTDMMIILKNAESRGEILLKKINQRVVSLPIDLLQHKFLIIHEPISDETIADIVDDIFLPLIRGLQ